MENNEKEDLKEKEFNNKIEKQLESLKNIFSNYKKDENKQEILYEK